jgi:hypothetical protein
MSISFLLQEPNAAAIWRGPQKNALTQQFLSNVDWTSISSAVDVDDNDNDTSSANGGLDYLIINAPPGTSDEHISTVQYLQQIPSISISAIVVTTPEEIACADVWKEINFCIKTNLPIIGVIENKAPYQQAFNRLTFIDSNNNNTDCTDYIFHLIEEKCPELLADNFKLSVDLFPSSTLSSDFPNQANAASQVTTTTTIPQPSNPIIISGGYQMAIWLQSWFLGIHSFWPTIIKRLWKKHTVHYTSSKYSYLQRSTSNIT